MQRFTEKYGLAGVVKPADLQRAMDAIAADLVRLDSAATPDRVVGMGGAVTNPTAVMLGLAEYDPGAVLTLREVERQIERYRSSTTEERRQIVGLQPNRAEVILAGACIVRAILRKLRKEELTVSDRGLGASSPSAPRPSRACRGPCCCARSRRSSAARICVPARRWTASRAARDPAEWPFLDAMPEDRVAQLRSILAGTPDGLPADRAHGTPARPTAASSSRETTGTSRGASSRSPRAPTDRVAASGTGKRPWTRCRNRLGSFVIPS
jgi:hypothetical protein